MGGPRFQALRVALTNRRAADPGGFSEPVARLIKEQPRIGSYLGSIGPHSVPVGLEMHRALCKGHNSLARAAAAYLTQWTERKGLQELVPVSPKVAEVLKHLSASRPFEIARMGTMRPDILFAGDSWSPGVCEINARFPLNGYLSSYLSNQTRREHMSGEGMQGLPALGALRSHLATRFDPNRPLFVITGREGGPGNGYDQHLVGPMLPELEVVRMGWEEVQGMTSSAFASRVSQCILELHQDELEALDVEKLLHLGSLGGACMNDLRVIFLLHDKRALAALRNHRGVLDGAVSEEDEETLQRFIIPTVPSEESESLPRGEWGTGSPGSSDPWRLLKPALFGKGEGIQFEVDLGRTDFDSLCQAGGSVVQPVVDQPLVEAPLGGEGLTPCAPVGTLLSMDGSYFGPGFFRFSNSRLTALSTGGIAAGCATEWPVLPDRCRFPLPSFGDADGKSSWGAVREALIRDGIALLTLPEAQAGGGLSEEEFEGVVRAVGGSPRPHSDKVGAVWNVRPGQPKAPGAQQGAATARSQTSDEFDWHTDASFEAPPPGFLAFSVLRSDRMGGGALQLVPVGPIVERMGQQHRDALQERDVRFITPDEFLKEGKDTRPLGRVLTEEAGVQMARFRSDKIDLSHLPAGQGEAMREALEDLSRAATLAGKEEAPPVILQEGSVLLFDNRRFLHRRDGVKDPARHSQRIRFDLEA